MSTHNPRSNKTMELTPAPDPATPARRRLLEIGTSRSEILLPASFAPSLEVNAFALVHRVCAQCQAAKVEFTGEPRCAACRATDIAAAPAPAPQPGSTVGELWHSLVSLPIWVWIQLGGIVAAALYCLAMDQVLPKDSSSRGAWGMSLLGFSFLVILLCKLWVLVKLIPSHTNLGLPDLFDVTRLWRLALRNMPETRWPIWMATWACAVAIGSVGIVGGQMDWLGARFPVLSGAHVQNR